MGLEDLIKVDALKDELRTLNELKELSEERQLLEGDFDSCSLVQLAELVSKLKEELDLLNLLFTPPDEPPAVNGQQAKNCVRIVLAKEFQDKFVTIFQDLAWLLANVDDPEGIKLKTASQVKTEILEISKIWKSAIKLQEELNGLIRGCESD